jgi:hypothetical protein
MEGSHLAEKAKNVIKTVIISSAVRETWKEVKEGQTAQQKS